MEGCVTLCVYRKQEALVPLVDDPSTLEEFCVVAMAGNNM